MEITQVPIDQLKGASYNPRSVSKHNFENHQRSLDEFNMVQPIVVNKRTNTIVGGHLRWAAAKALAWETVPVTYVDLDDKQERKLNIMLNDAKFQGEFDNDQLSELLHDLDASDLADLDYTDDEINKLQDGWTVDVEPVKEKGEQRYTIELLGQLAATYTLQPDAGGALDFVQWLRANAVV